MILTLKFVGLGAYLITRMHIAAVEVTIIHTNDIHVSSKLTPTEANVPLTSPLVMNATVG